MPDLLWIDDDGRKEGPNGGPGRFPYEERVLGRNGWKIHWARSGKKAADLLSEEVFQGVILDQMFPWKGRLSESEPVWAGCLLLAWLRGKDRPAEAPPIPGFEELAGYSPLLANQSIRVVLVSGFQDPDVERALRAIEPNLLQMMKPIDALELVRRWQ